MNLLEQQLRYPLGDTLPAPGQAIDVAPGVRWLRMALPFALDHINLWLLRDALDGPDGLQQGWTIVDCGIDDAPTRAAWEQVFAHHLDGLPVLRLIVTHMHPDHIGLAHWLVERWNVRLWISATDYHAARLATASTIGFGGAAAAAFMASHGLTDPDSLASIGGRTNYYAGLVPRLPAHYRRLQDGQTLTIGARAWTCHAGYGHAPEHMALHCAELDGGAPEAPAAPAPRGGAPELGAARRSGVLISGDMVLPRISTNVSVHDVEPEGNPLAQYLASIGRMRALPQDTFVLPSHGRPFTGLHTRIDQLAQHHEHHFGEVLEACREAPQHAADLLPVLFRRKLDLHQTTFAMGESIAHLHALWLAGRLARRLGEDGIFRFSSA